MSQHVFDYAVIGSGLSGLATAVRLSRETHNVVLLEGADQAGGLNRPIQFPTGVINNGLRSIADTALNREAILFLEDLLGLKVLKGSHEAPPVTYSEGQLREFIGFGDSSVDFYDQLIPFTNPQRLELHLEPGMWTGLLLEKFTGQFMPRSFVTRVQTEEGQAVALTINGAKTIKVQNVIYTGPVKGLTTLLHQDVLAPRARQKLSKNLYWTGVCLDLCHAKQISESEAVHILNGTTQDELGPCVGHFLPPAQTDKGVLQTSQWMTFLDEEVTEDSEIVATALKKIKRQIKRAYPEALDGLIRERIMVAPMIGGNGELKLNGDQSLPEIPNLWIASPALSPERGVTGALLQSRLVLASLGFGTSAETVPPEPPSVGEASL